MTHQAGRVRRRGRHDVMDFRLRGARRASLLPCGEPGRHVAVAFGLRRHRLQQPRVTVGDRGGQHPVGGYEQLVPPDRLDHLPAAGIGVDAGFVEQRVACWVRCRVAELAMIEVRTMPGQSTVIPIFARISSG
ncbi:hypothetical protein FAF44_13560 [Nonomuraea sp. MG754425]|uniref:hypothetical protein n=1 Tax=Nonomuraea sp. MG754425 TaxID=2570319 RepID=UPI001F3F2D2B|nr:hypothetical protein [Nonomuraea sp. MG754425]MCF6469410.1 hypothetical protein [Nonomuraea sp. MG754425]